MRTLGAFNDQVYQKAFVALVTYRLADQVGMPVAQLGVIASAIFILPFAIITPTAGQIADRAHDEAEDWKLRKGSWMASEWYMSKSTSSETKESFL